MGDREWGIDSASVDLLLTRLLGKGELVFQMPEVLEDLSYQVPKGVLHQLHRWRLCQGMKVHSRQFIRVCSYLKQLFSLTSSVIQFVTKPQACNLSRQPLMFQNQHMGGTPRGKLTIVACYWGLHVLPLCCTIARACTILLSTISGLELRSCVLQTDSESVAENLNNTVMQRKMLCEHNFHSEGRASVLDDARSCGRLGLPVTILATTLLVTILATTLLGMVSGVHWDISSEHTTNSDEDYVLIHVEGPLCCFQSLERCSSTFITTAVFRSRLRFYRHALQKKNYQPTRLGCSMKFIPFTVVVRTRKPF
ncbi:hypothetical protein V6N11_053903, partial [Hibiscus sabdariffa]